MIFGFHFISFFNQIHRLSGIHPKTEVVLNAGRTVSVSPKETSIFVHRKPLPESPHRTSLGIEDDREYAFYVSYVNG